MSERSKNLIIERKCVVQVLASIRKRQVLVSNPIVGKNFHFVILCPRSAQAK